MIGENGILLKHEIEFDVALIVAVDSENNIILKEEYRYPINEALIELPGGTLQEDEDPIQAAKRELKEETGYVSDEWQLLACNYDYPTKDYHTMYIAEITKVLVK